MAEKLVPKDRAEWLTFRASYVTSSEIGCLLDPDHPWQTPYGLWAEKTGKTTPNIRETAAMRRGKKVEKLGPEEVEERLPGATVEHNKVNAFWYDPALRIGATPDLIVHDPERGLGVVELKNPGVETYSKKWTDGEPPLFMALQVITAAKLVGAQWAAIGALRINDWLYDFDLVPVPLPDGAWSALTDAAGEFWRCVETDTPPVPNYKRDLAVISAMYPMDDGTAIDLSHDNELMSALADREECKKLEKELEDQIKQADALIKHKAGPHELIICGDYRCVLKTQQIAGYTVKPRVQRSLRIKKLGRSGEAAA